MTLDFNRNTALKKRWTATGIIAALIIILSLPLYLFVRENTEKQPADSVPAAPGFVGAQKCMECHKPEYDRWKNSHHDLAMDMAAEGTVLGDFNNTEIRIRGERTRFYKRGGRFFVHTAGPRGKAEEFRVTHVFGAYPLQQYLVPFPGGRLQCLPVAWDVEKGRWYALPTYTDDSSDWLHWTKPGQNWNTMCAECHLTNLKKGYDSETDTYNTTWSEMDVSCEACHGPGSDHVRWASLPALARGRDENPRMAVNTRDLSSAQLAAICFRCHSRRGTIDDYTYKHENLMDYLIPGLLEPELYFPDGQILDEVYVMGSFTQSKMYLRGVKCSDCHDVHSLSLKQGGNTLCLSCHRKDTYDTPDHHFHKKTHEGKDSPGDDCIQCHMPERTYMGIDNRADHSLRIPRPDLTLAYGIPNACNAAACHGDKTAEWSGRHLRKWYGERKRPHYAYTLAEGQKGAPEALSGLVRLSRDSLTPVIVRATALSLLRHYPGPDGLAALEQALMDPAPLMRHTAITVINQHRFPKKADLIFPLLYDPVRAVRLQAALGVASIRDLDLTPVQQAKFRAGLDEYIRAMRYTSDFPAGRYNLGLMFSALGQTGKAMDAYRGAIRLDDKFVPAKNNLAMLYNRTGQNREAEQLLKEILEDRPKLYEAAYSLGLLLTELKKFREAAVYLKKAAGGLPGRARVHYNLGLLLSSLNNGEEAEKALVKALSLDPDNFDYLWAMADFYLKTSRPGKAMEIAERLIENYPDQHLGHEIKAYINQLQ
ncbi:MAG: tetratricopeptide repeat protein [Desulfobacterales bacterium]|nr:tetratricopeptide repeat protein [Desulfobacterales bacterium]